MSRSVNFCVLVGNTGQEPTIRTLQSGVKVASFSLATTDTWTSKGEKQEKTHWHNCTAWNRTKEDKGLATIVEGYVGKGARLYIKGKIEYRQWTDKEGVKRYATDINVQELVMLDSKGGGTTPRKAQSESDEDFEDFPGGDDMGEDFP